MALSISSDNPESTVDRGLLILVSLVEGPKHGYAIGQDVQALADMKLGPGTLYGAMRRLELEGLIEEGPRERRRRPFMITVQGRDVLEARLTEMSKLSALGLKRLSGSYAAVGA